MGLKEEIVDLICKTLEVKPEEIKADQSLYDSIGVDSTEMVELRVSLNKSLGVELAQGEITNQQTPNQIVEIVDKKKQ
jgi:acyl carrier protein